jgi:hypothetical protein
VPTNMFAINVSWEAALEMDYTIFKLTRERVNEIRELQKSKQPK